MNDNREILLSVKNMDVCFGKRKNRFKAVNNVSFDIYKGETFGLVGESGSGKTTIGRAIARINPTTAGEVIFKGEKINGKISRQLDRQVTRQIQMIFQDPMASLNERAKIDYIVSEGLQGRGYTKKEILNLKKEREKLAIVLDGIKEMGGQPDLLFVIDTPKEALAIKEAKKLGLSASEFSMNVEGGRCEYCQGTGKKKIELTYMPDSYIQCPECHGKRFHEKVLSVKYKGVNINDILDYPIDRVIDKFKDVSSVNNILQCMLDIGMGYVSLGQMSMNLSGGEAQRIKLAKCLGVKSSGRNLYILDEPTSGLNLKDIKLFVEKSRIFLSFSFKNEKSGIT